MQSQLRQLCCSRRTACMPSRPGWMRASSRDFRGGVDHHILGAGILFLSVGLASSRVTFERLEPSLLPAAWVHHPPLPPSREHIAGMGEQQTVSDAPVVRQSARRTASTANFFVKSQRDQAKMWPVKLVACAVFAAASILLDFR